MSVSGAGDPLDAQAEKLVPSCKIWAITSFTQVIDRFKFLETCKPNDWDFFATTAAVTVAVHMLATKLPSDRFRHLNEIIQSKLREWDAQAPSALMDCLHFLNRTTDAVDSVDGNKTQQAVQALGLWVIWNLLQRQPTREEFSAANAIGMLLAQPLHDWWR